MGLTKSGLNNIFLCSLEFAGGGREALKKIMNVLQWYKRKKARYSDS